MTQWHLAFEISIESGESAAGVTAYREVLMAFGRRVAWSSHDHTRCTRH
jgi:hypothetical protein